MCTKPTITETGTDSNTPTFTALSQDDLAACGHIIRNRHPELAGRSWRLVGGAIRDDGPNPAPGANLPGLSGLPTDALPCQVCGTGMSLHSAAGTVSCFDCGLTLALTAEQAHELTAALAGLNTDLPLAAYLQVLYTAQYGADTLPDSSGGYPAPAPCRLTLLPPPDQLVPAYSVAA